MSFARPILDRRTMLRGLFGGAAVGIAIPTLDCFLNTNGDALASGAPLPLRFATYFWGLGLTPGRWVPSKVGADYEVTPEMESLAELRHKINVFSGFRVMLDGRPNLVHWTGQAAVLTGRAPAKAKSFDQLASIDTMVADHIGAGTRFRSVTFTPFGSSQISYSTRGGDSFAPSDETPMALYTRMFGEGFQDPNSGVWKPDAELLLQRSVLSSVADQRRALMSKVGASDKQRLDQYFTSLRETEEQIAVSLQKPAPAVACVVPASPGDQKKNGEVGTVTHNNKLMCDLIAMALACNQTKVVNGIFTSATSELYRKGDSKIYHTHTHEELVDDKLGYQPVSSELARDSVNGFAQFLKALDSVQEGDATLLDRSVVLGYSDTGYAKIHSTDNIPMFLAGGANGKMKGGVHYAVNGDPISRIVLTAQQLAGMPAGSWGLGSMQTSKPITEVLA